MLSWCFHLSAFSPKLLVVVYKFSCTGCGACYVGETNWHLTTRIWEHVSTNKNSHILQHLKSSVNFQALCFEYCFSIVDMYLGSEYFEMLGKYNMYYLKTHI